MVKSIPTICYEIQAEARKMAADLDAHSLTLRVNPEIAKALKTRESSLIEELEQRHAQERHHPVRSDAALGAVRYLLDGLLTISVIPTLAAASVGRCQSQQSLRRLRAR